MTNKQRFMNALMEYEGPIDDKKLKKLEGDLYGKETSKTKLLTTREAAELLGVHPVTLRLYAQKGLIQPVRYTARKIRWRQDTLESFMREGAHNGNN